ncbi:MAG: NlpC/P60 family protein [Actinobacteria bacterium]|nr:NlpC/P60 family protein [Actinomycetota bacterium]
MAAATGQVGMPYAWGTDGPGTFSCVGLVRHALRSAGVDANAPWDHMAYLSVYPTVSSPQPGDVVVYPDGAAMYVGDGTIVMANEWDQVVGYYPMDLVGTPVGFARPYGGPIDPAATGPADPVEVEPAMIDPTAVDPMIPADQTVVDPLAVEQPLAPEPFVAELPVAIEQPVIEQVPATEPVLTELPA